MQSLRSRIVGLRRSLLFGAAIASALVVVPIALAASRAYVVNVNVPAFNAFTDGVRHNHIYNEVFWNSGATWPSGLFERTTCCGDKWIKTGNGNLAYSHASTWFAEPFCHNRDSSTHFATSCVAEW
jgi:hypothetical protein